MLPPTAAEPPPAGPSSLVRAWVALGSNLGNRAFMLDAAEAGLGALERTQVVARSSRHETPALLPYGAPAEWDRPFLNAVVGVDTALPPRELLAGAKAIEARLGRRPGARWGPREIDIDILAWGDVVLAVRGLTLPHPELEHRRFVLAPWAEVAPDWRHPATGRTIRQMLEALP